MLSSQCPCEAFCNTKMDKPESCPIPKGEQTENAIDYIRNEETYVRMVFTPKALESDEALKDALSLDAIGKGASGNRVEKLDTAKYRQVIGEKTPPGFFTVNVGEARAIQSGQDAEGFFLFCPSLSGVHPDTHADIRSKLRYTKKPPNSWRSYRDKLLRLCTRCMSLGDVFEQR